MAGTGYRVTAEAAGAVGATVAHPLSPLGEREIERACGIVRAHRGAPEKPRFAMVTLDEPARSDVRAWEEGRAVARRALLVVIDRAKDAAFEYVVDLGSEAVVGCTDLGCAAAPYGQPPILIEEFFEVERIVKSDPAWRAAVLRRGLTEEDLELVQVDPFSAGYFAQEDEKGRRLVRAVCYYRESLKDNGYAHPIEGVVATVDVNRGKIVSLVDEPEVVPVPRRSRPYDTASLGTPRQDLKPLHIVQPEGPSFHVDGWNVDWQNWNFKVGFTPREGLVLHQLSYRDGERTRPVIYRASVTEMVVPYADPTANHYWKSAFDGGEYGLGKLANQLELGCDCLGLIRYFDIPAADDDGNAFLMKNAVCMHEEDYGILWKHYEFRNDTFEVRRSRRLVISFFATVGNYDYGFYWYLYQDGTIQLEAKLTGIIQTAAIAPGKPYPWGGMVDEGLGGPTHQHFFNARLHMSVDGEEGNSVSEHEFVPRPWGKDNPYGNVFDTTGRTLLKERDAAREACGRTGRYWKIFNPNKVNSVGNAPGYKLVVTDSPLMLAQPGSFVRNRGEFATKHVWVTRYAPDEKFASGDYPNQHAGGGGLPAYAAANRDIDNQDIVLWHSFGHTHVCKPEDFPIMPVEYAGFMLKPNGFFGANPAMDLPAERNAHSVQDSSDASSSSCCAGQDPA
ncbi:MAG: tyramine oxidase [Sphingobium sp.]|nr:MAG: tyramine oxidase [Sphingobium sp.]